MEILFFVLIGFLAQLVDGALGMAYGVLSTTLLLNLGLPPAVASASVHMSEMFTTAASGLSHLKFKNIDKAIFKALVIPGVLGGVLGAYILTALPGEKIKSYIAVYLLIMGFVVLFKSFNVNVLHPKQNDPHLKPLGLIGGFCDAIGGGGWGPIVTSTLMAKGNHPRLTIGSVNAAEFFVTVAQSATFFLTAGTFYWNAVIGLLIGGVIAAPFAAYISTKIPRRGFMASVGILIIAVSLRTLYKALF